MLSAISESESASTSDVGPSTLKRKKNTRQRLVHSVQALTPKCRKIYNKYLLSKKQLDFSKRARRAMEFSQTASFKKLTSKMNPVAKKIFWMQVQQCTKKVRGRRFSNEEKMIALSIMKQSPKCYKFLKRIFILPSKNTLNKMISNLKVLPGINKQIFDTIKQEVNLLLNILVFFCLLD